MNETIPEDYDNLLSNYKKLQKKYDDLNQALYDSNRQLKLAQASQAEYEDEIRTLQSTQDKKRVEIEAQITNEFEKKLQQQKNLFDEKISGLTQELLDKETIIKELRSKIDKLSVSEKIEEINEDLYQDLEVIREEKQKLAEQLLERDREFDELKKQHFMCDETLKNLKDEVEYLTEDLNSKKEELGEAKNLISSLQDDMVFMKMDLDSLKNKPLNEETRGNSLFAEVNDKRVQLQQNFKIMKERFNEMKRDRVNLLNENSKLRLDIAALHAQWKTEFQLRVDEEDSETKSLKYQVNTLSDLIKSYKKDMSEKQKTEIEDEQFFKNMLENKKSEIEDLRQKLFLQSFNYDSLRRELLNANREIRKWKHEVDLMENKIGVLKVQIERNECPIKTIEDIEKDDQKDLHNLMKMENTILELTVMDIEKDNSGTENKENINKENTSKKAPRSVRFTENLPSLKDEKVTFRKPSTNFDESLI